MKDKREIIRARKAFRRSLKDEKKFLKKGKKEVRKQKKDSAVLDEKAWKKEIKEKESSENALVLVATVCCCMKSLLLALVHCYCLLVQQGDVSV